MKKILGRSIFALIAVASLVGCQGGSDAEMTKQQADALKSPSKSIPPEAAQGMAKMGEMVKKQAEANKAAGVDSRGVPISKSTETAPPPPGQ
jgi:hypothetical protein